MPKLHKAVPILSVSDFQKSMKFYEDVLGFQKHWEWGSPPNFGSVGHGSVEVFLCLNDQGNPGTWIMVFMDDLDRFFSELKELGVKPATEPRDMEWGVREMHIKDPDGHVIRFAQSQTEQRVIKRSPLSARVEERLANVLIDLARETDRTVGEVLEEIVLHSFEPVPGKEGAAVASPHKTETFALIEQLKRKHGIDYETHANYGFIEEEMANEGPQK